MGLIISATIVLPLLVGIYIGAAVDIVGVAGIARWSSLLFAAAYVVMVVGEGLRSLALGLAMVGLADSGLVVASQTYVAAYSAPADRDRNFGSYTIWVSLGALLGPILGGVLADRWGYRAVFAGSLVLGVLTALVCWSLPRQRTQSPAGERRFTGTLRAAIDMLRQPAILRVMLINACAMFAFSLRQSFYPVYLQSIGFSTTLMARSSRSTPPAPSSYAPPSRRRSRAWAIGGCSRWRSC